VDCVITDGGVALWLEAQEIEIMELIRQVTERVIEAFPRGEVDVFAAG
jgi:hypothetical protein